MSLKRYKIIISYDGTNYAGWQIQPNAKTVQEVLQKTFVKTFHQEVHLLASSRTDAGVHARGQVALVKTTLDLEPVKIQTVWNLSLPEDIQINSCVEVDLDFHPHKNVLQKTYTYLLFLERPDPFYARFGWFYQFIDQVDWQRFQECLMAFQGSHEFKDFCMLDPKEPKVTKRDVDKIQINFDDERRQCLITFQAKGFLRFQIRRMLGCALEFAIRNNLSLENMQKSLVGEFVKSDLLSTFCASGKGLCLVLINFDKR